MGKWRLAARNGVSGGCRSAFLLNDHVPVVLLHDVLDSRLFVPRRDDESSGMLSDTDVLLWSDLNLDRAARVRALADRRHGLIAYAKLLFELRDVLVDLAEECLVTTNSFLPKAHADRVAGESRFGRHGLSSPWRVLPVLHRPAQPLSFRPYGLLPSTAAFAGSGSPSSCSATSPAGPTFRTTT